MYIYFLVRKRATKVSLEHVSSRSPCPLCRNYVNVLPIYFLHYFVRLGDNKKGNVALILMLK